jgi:ABC-type polysaccharide/polyol phosphate export permease
MTEQTLDGVALVPAKLGFSFSNFGFVLTNLVAKDFKIRYRNMSLGVLWSLANPLIMMLVLDFVFTKIFPNPTAKSYPAFVLCGLIPFNFFSGAWNTGTASLYSNAPLVKRVPMMREIIPLSTVLASCIHFLIQLVLLLILVVMVGNPVTIFWLWIPSVLMLEIAAVSGLALICSALDVYLRDTRYVVESLGVILFWASPIIYPFRNVPAAIRGIYLMNPAAAAIVSLRSVLLDGTSPSANVLVTATVVSLLLLSFGLIVFRRLSKNFADYL